MSSLLIRDCDVIVTMDDRGTEIPGGSVLIDDGVIAWVGKGDPPRLDDAAHNVERIDGHGTVALPGLINTHHHLYQSLTRLRAQDQGLFGWLRELYPIWAGLDEEWQQVGAQVGLAELALSGCTTTTDHHYVFPQPGPDVFPQPGPDVFPQPGPDVFPQPGPDVFLKEGRGFLEAEIRAAREIGLRFHPCRGSMDLGASAGGLPPASIVQDVETILAQTEEAVSRFHDPAPGAMLRMAVAPCSPFSVTERLMRESAGLARRLGVRLHTHIAETLDEEAYCLATYGKRPVALLADLGWLGPDVWLAHCVHLNGEDIERLASTGTGVAWCPTSNLRLGSGIAPARALLDAGVSVGLAVDGSASNDAGHLLGETRQAMLVARLRGASQMSAREALIIATRGGAACLGRDDIGSLEAGKRADVALFSVDGLEFVGAEADPVAALLFCAPQRVRDLWVEGRRVVQNSRLASVDEERLAADGHRVAERIRGRSVHAH